MLGCVEHFRQRSEALQKLLGERLGVALSLGAEQQRFQELVVRKGLGADLADALAHPLAVAEIVWLVCLLRGSGRRWQRTFGEEAAFVLVSVRHLPLRARKVKTRPKAPAGRGRRARA